jgi:hypothetical protein
MAIFSCGTPAVYEQVVRSPVPEQDVSFTRVEVDADSLVAIELTTGTRVQFAPSSFETMEGKPVKGKLELRVREFQSAIELFRAGIPMSVDENRQQFLQSAGMFEVRARQGEKELKLKAGRSGSVELAGFRPADGYSLYQLGDDVRWRVTDTFASVPNKRKQEKMNRLDSLQRGQGLQEDGFEIAADLSEVPYLKPFKGLLWKPVGSGKKARDLAEAMRYAWDSVRVEPVRDGSKRFRLHFMREFRYRDSLVRRVVTVFARPELKGRTHAELMKEMEANNKKIEEERRRIAAEANMVNAFTIRELGIWNIDRMMKMEDRVIGSASFDFQKEIEGDWQKIKLFVVYDDENMVIPIHPRDWEQLQLLRNTPVRFFAVLPGNRTVVTDYEQIRAVLNSGTKVWAFKTRPATAADWVGRGS